MNRKGLSLASLMLVAASGLYGCSDGDESVINITSTPGDGGSTEPTNPTSICPDWSLARPQDDGGNDVCQLPAEIMEDRTLTSDKVWYMASRVTVGNGNQEMSVTEGILNDTPMTPVANVTLTIEAGTEIKGRTGSFANLIITRGSRIEANGTSALPIIFSSDDDGYDGAGEWGGLILHGYAQHNECLTADQGAVPCNIDSEGESGFAGGYSNDDSSGTLRYVIVTEGGFEFAIGDEINGISLVGVGAGTTIENIQVNSNADDGVEFYGGTVSMKNVVLTGNLDDSVDWDEGWWGNLQYVLVIQSADTTGNVIEADTRGTDDFLSKPTIANATFIGNGSQTTGGVFKAASGGYLHYSIITFDASITDATTCVDTSAATTNGSGLAFDNVLCDGDAAGNGQVTLIGDVALDASYASTAVEATGLPAFDGALTTFIGGNAEASESVTAAGGVGFFDGTTFAGAIEPGVTPWYEGWTLEGTVTTP